MQLLTDELRAQLPALYAQNGATDMTINAKFFTPDSSWTWYVAEGQQEDDDFIFFGYVNGHDLEAGYFSLKDLESVRGPWGLPIERDLHFEPGPWTEVKRREGLDKGFEGFGLAQLMPVFAKGCPLLWRREEDGTLKTNVTWCVRHHSPTGFEIGYTGSGPADLALNAMAALFPVQGEEAVTCFDGSVSRQAWDLHQKFKSAFLEAADRNSGCIEWETIEAWLQQERGNDDQDNRL